MTQQTHTRLECLYLKSEEANSWALLISISKLIIVTIFIFKKTYRSQKAFSSYSVWPKCCCIYIFYTHYSCVNRIKTCLSINRFNNFLYYCPTWIILTHTNTFDNSIVLLLSNLKFELTSSSIAWRTLF